MRSIVLTGVLVAALGVAACGSSSNSNSSAGSSGGSASGGSAGSSSAVSSEQAKFAPRITAPATAKKGGEPGVETFTLKLGASGEASTVWEPYFMWGVSLQGEWRGGSLDWLRRSWSAKSPQEVQKRPPPAVVGQR